jgi:hypothetical protein
MSTTPFTSNMFESIKSAFTKQAEENSQKYKDFLRTEAGNSYVVRLLPNVKNPAKTFFHYYSYTWNSFANGQLVSVVSPATWGQRDPIAEERFRVLRTGSEEEKKKAGALIRRENWMVNAYVISDPVNAGNNGQIKIFRFGKQINKIVKDAISGEEAADFGPKIFDLSPNGCSFRIKVEKQGDYPTYVSSRFLPPKEIEGLSADNYQNIYSNIFDLETYVTVKSYDEIKTMLDEHYHCKEASVETQAPVVEAPKPAAPAVVTNSVQEVLDTSIDDLLKGLDS